MGRQQQFASKSATAAPPSAPARCRPTLDRNRSNFIADWLLSDANQPPKYPFPIDAELAGTRQADLRRVLRRRATAPAGRDFSGGADVGKVDPIDKIRTDPCRLDNYTHALAAEQGNLYAAYPEERFSHFRKTDGYANLPLDGIWLRGPYLHNGSVPTVRDLLEPRRQPAAGVLPRL